MTATAPNLPNGNSQNEVVSSTQKHLNFEGKQKNSKNFRKNVWRIEKSCIFAPANRKIEGH